MNEAEIERLKCLLSKVTYKSGWRFDFEPPARIAWSFTIILSHMETDIVTGKLGLFAMPYEVDLRALAAMTDDQFVDHVLRQLVLKAEVHEVDEWLKYEGRCVREPHSELA